MEGPSIENLGEEGGPITRKGHPPPTLRERKWPRSVLGSKVFAEKKVVRLEFKSS